MKERAIKASARAGTPAGRAAPRASFGCPRWRLYLQKTRPAEPASHSWAWEKQGRGFRLWAGRAPRAWPESPESHRRVTKEIDPDFSLQAPTTPLGAPKAKAPLVLCRSGKKAGGRKRRRASRDEWRSGDRKGREVKGRTERHGENGSTWPPRVDRDLGTRKQAINSRRAAPPSPIAR